MKTEHPILFSREMVEAILDGRKTMTRRVIRPQPKVVDNIDEGNRVEWSCKKWPKLTVDCLNDLIAHCPYGKVGDLLWAKTGRFMPKKAATIWLEITNIRVERLQEISCNNITAEGVKTENTWGDWHYREEFQKLWDSINAKRGYGWDTNPFVWVIEFRKKGVKK